MPDSSWKTCEERCPNTTCWGNPTAYLNHDTSPSDPGGCPTWDNPQNTDMHFGFWLTHGHETPAGYTTWYSQLKNAGDNWFENCQNAALPVPSENTGFRHVGCTNPDGAGMGAQKPGSFITGCDWSNNGPYDQTIVDMMKEKKLTPYTSTINDLGALGYCTQTLTDGVYGMVSMCTNEEKCGESSTTCKKPPSVAQYRDKNNKLVNVPSSMSKSAFNDRYAPVAGQECTAPQGTPIGGFGEILPGAKEPIWDGNSYQGNFTLYCPNWAAGDIKSGERSFIQADTTPTKNVDQTIIRVAMDAAAAAATWWCFGCGALITDAIYQEWIQPTDIQTEVIKKLDGTELPNTDKHGYQFRAYKAPYCQLCQNGNTDRSLRYGDTFILYNTGLNKFVQCGGGTCSSVGTPGVDGNTCTKASWQTFQILPGQTIVYNNYSKVGDMVCYGDIIQIKQLASDKFFSPADLGKVITCSPDDCKGGWGGDTNRGKEALNYNMMICPPSGCIYKDASTWTNWEYMNLVAVNNCNSQLVPCWLGKSYLALQICSWPWPFGQPYFIIPAGIFAILIIIGIIFAIIKLILSARK